MTYLTIVDVSYSLSVLKDFIMLHQNELFGASARLNIKDINCSYSSHLFSLTFIRLSANLQGNVSSGVKLTIIPLPRPWPVNS